MEKRIYKINIDNIPKTDEEIYKFMETQKQWIMGLDPASGYYNLGYVGNISGEDIFIPVRS